MPMEAIGSPSKYCFTLLSFTVLIYYPSLISCTHEFWKISKQIWDSKIRWQKKFETPRHKNHLKTRLRDPSKTFPRFQDLAKIFLDLCFSSYHSLPLFSPQSPWKNSLINIQHIYLLREFALQTNTEYRAIIILRS